MCSTLVTWHQRWFGGEVATLLLTDPLAVNGSAPSGKSGAPWQSTWERGYCWMNRWRAALLTVSPLLYAYGEYPPMQGASVAKLLPRPKDQGTPHYDGSFDPQGARAEKKSLVAIAQGALLFLSCKTALRADQQGCSTVRVGEGGEG